MFDVHTHLPIYLKRGVWHLGHVKEKQLNIYGILERDSEINELRLLRNTEIIKLPLKTTRFHLLQWTENDILCCLGSVNRKIFFPVFWIYDQDFCNKNKKIPCFSFRIGNSTGCSLRKTICHCN